MRERPILFSGAMVRAILEGRKTQTRRPVQWPVLGKSDGAKRRIFTQDDADDPSLLTRCPYGRPGGRLWVREAWASQQPGIVAYRADGEAGAWMGDGGGGRIWVHHGWIHGATDGTREGRWCGLSKYGGRWRSPIFMPRWASRLTLEVTEVRVQRLQDISEEDAVAEGLSWVSPTYRIPDAPATARGAFYALWDTVNGKRAPWSSNPWVWAVSFRRVAP